MCAANDTAAETWTQSQLETAFSPAVLQAVRDFWFKDIADGNLILPAKETAGRWFRSNPDFDAECVANFNHQLSVAQSPVITASDILAAAKPKSPLDWLSLLILLDQIPRNAFRGDEARRIFSQFDPKALDIALQAIAAGIPEQTPIRYRLSYRLWFYLPLQHSEDPKIQDMSIKEHAKMFEDARGLLEGMGEESDDKEDAQRCRDVYLTDSEGVERWAGMMMSFAQRHRDLIGRFGRYPHRNEVLGREMTEEEERFLAEGGETFGAKKVEGS
ncbi:hypothetical protein B0T17DRAFT_621064 [Bombardia bombarda]|uniref:DUF924-domain-containing protein n=1 Tax=Bombardia bombarda TaxID=252184 RepID=A0AA39TMJ7_9PEZI|nr:hypothetical protein B0T17DRAFT_621064 [Bombardia bombarda]